jgi:hypothetical protein
VRKAVPPDIEALRCALDEKIDRAMSQVVAGHVYGPEEAMLKLASLKAAHLGKRLNLRVAIENADSGK